jgi:hypothetical protein
MLDVLQVHKESSAHSLFFVWMMMRKHADECFMSDTLKFFTAVLFDDFYTILSSDIRQSWQTSVRHHRARYLDHTAQEFE